MTPSQESTGVGSKPFCGRLHLSWAYHASTSREGLQGSLLTFLSSGHCIAAAQSSQQADASVPRSRKRGLDEIKATDPPEDEQHSSQSAFQQCCPNIQQNSIQQPQALRLASNPQALQLLLSAAQSCEALNQSIEGAAMSTDRHLSQHVIKPALDDTERPSAFVRPNSAFVSRVSPFCSAQRQPQQNLKQALNDVGIMYAPIRSACRISAQLVWDTQRLDLPGLDADAVQAALEFADAVRINPAQHAQQPGCFPQHSAEQVTLLHTLELGVGRLDVLRILAHRLRSSSSLSEMSHTPGGLGQLLDVMQDLLKDMEASRLLLCHAEQTVLAYQQAALARVDSLQVHSRAAQAHWLQTQRLQEVAAQRRSVLQRMMM